MRRQARLALCAAALALVTCGTAPAEQWSFGVMGDTQWGCKSDMANNPNSVPVGIIKQINTEFFNHGVKFVIQVGDLTDDGSIAGLKTRFDANDSLKSAGIDFYALRGNHEDNRAAQKFFRKHCIPESTSSAKVSINPSDHTSYSVTCNNTKLVLLDITAADSTSAMDADTSWMDSELAADDHTNAFVLGHKNLQGQNHKDNMFGDGNDANPAQQNSFIADLARHNVPLYISGHDHMHNRSTVTSPDGKSSVQQLICASDSYKFYNPQTPFSSRNVQISQELYTIGYYIFTVDGTKVKVDYYAAPNGVGDHDLIETPSLRFSLHESWTYDFASTAKRSDSVAASASASSVRAR